MAFEEDRQYDSLLTKVQKACRIAYLILKIVFFIVLAIWVLLLLVFVAICFFPLPAEIQISFDVLSFAQLLISGILSLALIRLSMLIIREVVRGKSPFTKIQSKRIRYMSYIMFAQVLIELLSSTLLSTFLTNSQFAMSFHTVGASEPTMYINLQVLVFAVIMLCLSLVFEYGSLLQRDKDEII